MLINKSQLVVYYCVLYVCCILSYCTSTGAKVRQRFNLEQLHHTKVRASIPKNPITSMDPTSGNVNRAGQNIYKLIQSRFGVFNLTVTFVSHGESGVPDEYGNYSGLIGMVQRNETDLMFFMVRPDALPFEPVRIGAVYGSDEMVLLASRQPPKPKELDLSYLFSNFDELTYCYLAFCTFLVVVLSIVGLAEFSNWESSRHHRFFEWIAMLKHAYTYCWSILEMLVDQENHNPRSWTNRLLWLSYCIAAFVLIFGFFTNLLSTDMIAFIKPPELRSLDVLFTPYFESVQPIVLTNLPSYSLIKHAEPGTQLGALYQRLTRNSDISCLTVQLNDSRHMLSMSFATTDAIVSGKQCFATTSGLVKLIQLCVCGIKPAQWSGAYHSTTFAQGLITSYYNKALPAHAARFIDYKNRNFHEMAILGHEAMRTMQVSMAQALHEELNWQSFKCYHGMTDRENGIENANEIQLALSTAANVFQYAFYAMGLAMLVLLVECLMHLAKKFIRKCKASARKNAVAIRRPTRNTREARKWASMQKQLTGRH